MIKRLWYKSSITEMTHVYWDTRLRMETLRMESSECKVTMDRETMDT